MSAFKGTKGKWEITKESEARIQILSGSIDVWIYGKDRDLSIDEMKSNAQLISKAPEMLEILQLTCMELESAGKTHWDIYGIIKQLIKEATTI